MSCLPPWGCVLFAGRFPDLGAIISGRISIHLYKTKGGICLSGPFAGTRSSGPSSEGCDRRVHWSEGPACEVRCATFDNPARFIGHDKRARRTFVANLAPDQLLGAR